MMRTKSVGAECDCPKPKKRNPVAAGTATGEIQDRTSEVHSQKKRTPTSGRLQGAPERRLAIYSGQRLLGSILVVNDVFIASVDRKPIGTFADLKSAGDAISAATAQRGGQ